MKQAQALEILKTGQNVFLTGQAGSGKTYVLNQYVSYLRSKEKSVSVTATTGIAATHLNGLTVHSWSGLGVKDQLYPSELEKMMKKRHLRRNIMESDVLIIDEISMLHARQLDLINQICQAFRQSLKPFGGLQVVLTGDFFQLPPVTRGEDQAQMAMRSDIWPLMSLKTCYLDEQYRQEDNLFINILNEIRKNSLSQVGREALMSRLHYEFEEGFFLTKLYTHNVDVDAINLRELEKLPGVAKAYRMQAKGNQTLAEILQKGCLAPEVLLLKKGAKVMFVKNNFELGVVNGTVGEIVDFDEDNYPVVLTNHGEVVVATPADWVIEEEGKIRAEIKQIPLRLAWAITVHKSQGLSLDAAEIDLSKAFTPGMGYVALSRVRSLDGLRLIGLNEMALTVDAQVLELDKKFQEWSGEVERQWENLSVAEKERWQKIFVKENLDKPKKEKKKGGNKEKTRALLEAKKALPEIAQELGLTIGTIVGHVEKLLADKKSVEIDYLLPSQDDLQRITRAFEAEGWEYLRPVYEHLEEIYSYETLRVVRAWAKAGKSE